MLAAIPTGKRLLGRCEKTCRKFLRIAQPKGATKKPVRFGRFGNSESNGINTTN